jgi:hypothetical protein
MARLKWIKPSLTPFVPFLRRHCGLHTWIIHTLNHAPSTYLVGVIAKYLSRDLALAPFCLKDTHPGELEMVNGGLEQHTQRERFTKTISNAEGRSFH